LNLRPSGYEPDELPGCSTPHQVVRRVVLAPSAWPVKRSASFRGWLRRGWAVGTADGSGSKLLQGKVRQLAAGSRENGGYL
jgi:hypothetical protein